MTLNQDFVPGYSHLYLILNACTGTILDDSQCKGYYPTTC